MLCRQHLSAEAGCWPGGEAQHSSADAGCQHCSALAGWRPGAAACLHHFSANPGQQHWSAAASAQQWLELACCWPASAAVQSLCWPASAYRQPVPAGPAPPYLSAGWRPGHVPAGAAPRPGWRHRPPAAGGAPPAPGTLAVAAAAGAPWPAGAVRLPPPPTCP